MFLGQNHRKLVHGHCSYLGAALGAMEGSVPVQPLLFPPRLCPGHPDGAVSCECASGGCRQQLGVLGMLNEVSIEVLGELALPSTHFWHLVAAGVSNTSHGIRYHLRNGVHDLSTVTAGCPRAVLPCAESPNKPPSVVEGAV